METSGTERTDEEAEKSRDRTTQDFLTGLKERETLKTQLSQREKELGAVKSQNYDLIKKIEVLEKEVYCSTISWWTKKGLFSLK